MAGSQRYTPVPGSILERQNGCQGRGGSPVLLASFKVISAGKWVQRADHSLIAVSCVSVSPESLPPYLVN